MDINSEVEFLENFEFITPGVMADGDLTLELLETSPYNPANGYVPEYKFAMINAKTNATMGAIDLRVCLTDRLKLFLGRHLCGESFQEGAKRELISGRSLR